MDTLQALVEHDDAALILFLEFIEKDAILWDANKLAFKALLESLLE